MNAQPIPSVEPSTESTPVTAGAARTFQFAIPLRELKTAMPSLRRLARSNATLPVLATILVEREKGETRFTATNLDQRVTYTVPSDTPPPASELGRKLLANRSAREDGAICVLIKELATILKNADAASDIVFTPRSVRYKFGGNIASLELDEKILSDDFPPADRPFSEPHSLSEQAKHAIIACLPNVTEDETRYILRGVYVDAPGKAIIATNGRSLTVFELNLPSIGQLIIPSEAVALLTARHLLDAPWTIACGKKPTLQICAGNFTIQSKLIEGDYPVWKTVVPPIDDKIQIKIPLTMYSRPEISNLLKRLPKDPKNTNDPVRLKVSKDKLTFSVGGASFSVSVLIEASPVKDSPWRTRTTNANRAFWQRAIDLGATELRFADELSPVAAHNRQGMTYVFMPVRIGEPIKP